MNAKEFNESINKIINVDEKTKQGILELIDIKLENDMEKLLNEIKRLEDKIDTKTTMLMWSIGIIMGLIGILITVLVASKFIH